MVSSGAFWAAISYRLAACFTGIGSACGVEIYWRSFRHFGNYNYSLRKTVGKKMTKMGQKLIKIAQKSRCFCKFSVFVLLKFLRLQSRATIQWPSAEPMARKRSTGQKTERMTRQLIDFGLLRSLYRKISYLLAEEHWSHTNFGIWQPTYHHHHHHFIRPKNTA